MIIITYNNNNLSINKSKVFLQSYPHFLLFAIESLINSKISSIHSQATFCFFLYLSGCKIDRSFVKNLEVHITSDTEDFLDLYPYKSTYCIDD